MTKKLATEEDLKQLINNLIHTSEKLDRLCKDTRILSIQKQEPDEDGCNWDALFHSGPLECTEVVINIVNKIRQQYNLTE